MAFKNTSFSMVMVAMLLLALMASHAEASSFTAYSGPGCSGRWKRWNQCGCSNIDRYGGYQFIYNGQTARLYNRPGCGGSPHTQFGSSARGCRPFGWRSIYIQC